MSISMKRFHFFHSPQFFFSKKKIRILFIVITNMSTCQHANMSTCQHANMSTCQHANMSTCQHANMSIYRNDTKSFFWTKIV